MGSIIYPKVSFIIPTLNEGKNIARCLHAIKTQDYPQDKIEIIVADAKSTDKTVAIAQSYGAKIVENKYIHQEPGKTMAAKYATGDILFYTDADNVLAHNNWLKLMTKPYMVDPTIMGFLPQTIPAPDTNSIDKYFGYLCTEPFTWFIYGHATTPRDYGNYYKPIKQTSSYRIYRFPSDNHPLLGLAQGFGTNRNFNRDKEASGDDITAGIRIIEKGGRIAYVPDAGIYHYHIDGLNNFIKKYTWRVRNNLSQTVQKMGLTHRKHYYTLIRKIRMALFIPYALTIIFPTIDAILMSIRFHDPVMLWHVPLSWILAVIIIKETISFYLCRNIKPLGLYEK